MGYHTYGELGSNPPIWFLLGRYKSFIVLYPLGCVPQGMALLQHEIEFSHALESETHSPPNQVVLSRNVAGSYPPMITSGHGVPPISVQNQDAHSIC